MLIRGVVWGLVILLLVGADFRLWRARRREGVLPNLRAAALIAPGAWGKEPDSPADVDVAALGGAIRRVCGSMPKSRAERYAQAVIESAAAHGEDPFLLAALMTRMSRCRPDARNTEGLGLTSIAESMYRTNIRGRVLHYFVEEQGHLVAREQQLPFGFFERTLLSGEHNLRWAAALLQMWREQHALVDAEFAQVPHRHYVSHFVWGDRVKSARPEDRIFTDRRRLLMHYGPNVAARTTEFKGLSWSVPLEGGPRVVSSEPGADREQGLRVHRGVDVEAMFGEPVLAMADGRVSFAGVDLPGRGESRDLSPERIPEVPRKQLGRGGRYVCITHLDAHEDEAWLRSCYMHLEDVHVRAGQRVQRGELIGTVGRTGMKRSAPHLHLELKSDQRLYDAREALPGLLIGEPPADPPKRRRRRRSSPAEAETVRTGAP